MPELPEVETIKRGLEKSVVGKTISDFDCDWKKMINKPLTEYRKVIKGLKIEGMRRRAKMLIIDLQKDWHLLVHLKMTGQLVYASKIKCVVGGHRIAEGYQCLPNKFTHATITFSDNSRLFFNDIRKFGWMRLYTGLEVQKELENMKLGPEPLASEFTLEYLHTVMKKRPNNKIKQFLMDSKVVVGVGNIYSDEVCFYAKVKPMRKVKSLKENEIKLIYKAIRTILEASIKAQGTTFSDFRNADGEAGGYSAKLKAYGRYGEPCKVCKSEIKRWKMGGRSSSYCPKCQK
ncbi:MAG: bifunctional DNA-formamidopyrimidine glycosylase/DNA-(apurinic or apyrimidinic site) lyase [Candidatus Parcubacteria bacterium]|nr:bifunctional DNA-formamidopyrimidine glycosylase/DNA-(apurinic or apyrimidinic site) lyase [Candidatus Parcubacteria bacterium]